MSESSFNRRQVLKAGAGAAAAAATVSAATGAAAAAGYDASYDVIIVGSGTGLCAALCAARSGLKVLVLEKDKVIGGTTLVSGGVLWVPDNHIQKRENLRDNREGARAYLEHLAQGQAAAELIDAFLDHGSDMLAFIEESTSIEWRVSLMMGAAADYHPEWRGSNQKGRSVEPVRESVGMSGGILVAALVEACRERGVEFRTGTPARELISVDSDSGVEVRGVQAEELATGRVSRFEARRAVLIASGGFERNETMKTHFLRGPVPYSLGAEENKGDGVRMGMAVGADLRNMNECYHQVVYTEEAKREGHRRAGISLSAQIERRSPGGICVNRYGERFAKEAAAYDVTWRSFHTWENWGEVGFRNLPAYAIFDSTVRRNFTIAGRTHEQDLPDWVIRADTIAGLAGRLGIDEAGLAATLERFNRNAARGQDPDYHRGESLYDRSGGDAVTATLRPLLEGPFYGAEVSPGTLGTCGGLRVNGRAQVVDVFDRPIRGLYAAGNSAGVGSPGALYGGGGGTLGPAFTFSYIAGIEMANP
jgi:succinate dehydrogenase/fumarate reductase flavoprotein subunit